MKNYLIILATFITLYGFSQTAIDESAVPGAGISYQNGPGGGNSQNWTYNYGVKLSVFGSTYRNFELMNTQKTGTSTLAMRTYDPAIPGWTDWREFIYKNSSGNVGIGTTSPEAELHVSDGFVKSGTVNATQGSLQFGGNYSADHIINTYGSQYSTGATSIGYAVKQKNGSQGIVSSAGNTNFKKGMLIMDQELEFLNAGAATVPVGNNVSLTSRFIVKENGNVGIGTTSPAYKLDVKGDIRIGYNQYLFGRRPDGGTSKLIGYRPSESGHHVLSVSEYSSIPSEVRIYTPTDPNQGVSIYSDQRLVFFRNDGNVGIGVNNPNERLVVDGNIRSEEVKVEIINGPDYVFEPDYDLLTLEETKEYIEENKHLPEIPSAKEMETNGVDLGDMNMRLLKKIEELTLYQIELLERLERAEKEIADLRER